MTLAITGRRSYGRILALAVVIVWLSACGSDSAGPAPDSVSTATPEPVAVTTITSDAASPSPVTTSSTPAPDITATVILPTPDQPFVSDQADLGPIVWTVMVDPATLAPTQPVDTFTVDTPTLYAAIPIHRIEPGTTVSSAWVYNDTPINGAASTFTATEEAAGVWLEFHLTRTATEEWPDGTFAVTIFVDGIPALAASIEVVPLSQ